ncbi:hypothetical protein FACS1894184_13560 [Clostridia bacterium]|nr:hypothetical protein FACS1894184_13560 [Clostridia bacterium]
MSFDSKKPHILIGSPYCVSEWLDAGEHVVSFELASSPVYAVTDMISSLNITPPLGMTREPEYV